MDVLIWIRLSTCTICACKAHVTEVSRIRADIGSRPLSGASLMFQRRVRLRQGSLLLREALVLNVLALRERLKGMIGGQVLSGWYMRS